MSECSYSAKLGAYLDGELEPQVRATVGEHIAGCPLCAAELARLEALVRLVGAAPQVRMSPFALQRVHAAVDAAMEAGFVRAARVLASLAACVLVASSLVLWQVRPAAPLQTAPPWVDVASAGDEANSSGALTPAAQWYLANAGNRGGEE